MAPLQSLQNDAQVEDDIDFCTLGMFIIDEIHFQAPTPPVVDILGGAGSYSAVGARIFSPPPHAKSVGWIVDAGSDFPDALRRVIASWDTSCVVRETPDRLTTRGWNGYGANEHRAFKYLTPKLRLDHETLTPRLLSARSFHLICSPGRCVDLVQGILSRRGALGKTSRPLFVWEPVPDLCTPAELPACYEAIKHVDVISPNHDELCAFFGERPHHDNGDAAAATIAVCAAKLLDSGIGEGGEGAVVVRVGKDGCYVASRGKQRNLPAYHHTGTGKVVDPTGGGNSFLGGFCKGLVRAEASGDFTVCEEAALWGSVAASFAIEQVGMPKLASSTDGETWNGESAMARLEALRLRVASYIQPS